MTTPRSTPVFSAALAQLARERRFAAQPVPPLNDLMSHLDAITPAAPDFALAARSGGELSEPSRTRLTRLLDEMEGEAPR